jgi:DNA-binding GntR family transcriptional regulator
MLRALAVATVRAVAEGTLNLERLPPATGRLMEQAIAAVHTAIDAGRMKPGVKYSVYQLAELLGISRTPVREALLRLEAVGLVKFEPRQGFTIVLPQPEDIAEIFAIRLALELPAVRKVAAAADPDLMRALVEQRHQMKVAARNGVETEFAQRDLRLHDLILEAAGNARSRAIVNSLRQTTRLLGASTADKTRTLRNIDTEHQPIVDAIIAANPSAAEAAMRSHLVNTGKLLVSEAIRANKIDVGVDEIWSNVLP